MSDRCDGTGYWYVVCADEIGTAFNIKEGDFIVCVDGFFCREDKKHFEQTYEVIE